MLNRGFVCWRCQLRALRQPKAPTKPQWRSKASIASAVSPQPARDDGKTSESQPQRRPGRLRRRKNSAESRLVDLFLDKSPTTPRRPADKLSGAGEDDTAHALEDGNDGDSISLNEAQLGAAAKLDQLASNPETLSEAWTHFLEHLSLPDSVHRANPAFQDLPYLQEGAVFHKLLESLVGAWLKDPKSSLPPPSLVLEKLEAAGTLRAKSYHDVGWRIVSHILWLEKGKETPTANYGSDLVLSELIKLWTVVFTRFGQPLAEIDISSEDGSPAWKELEVRARKSPDSYPADFRVEVRMQALLQNHPRNIQLSLSALGLVSYDILLRHAFLVQLDAASRANCNGLLHVIAMIIHRRPLDRLLLYIYDQLRDSQEQLHIKTIKDYIRQLSALPNRSLSVLAPKSHKAQPQKPGAQEQERTSIERLARGERPTFSSSERAEHFFSKAIIHAGQHQFGTRLDSIWENAVIYYTQTSGHEDRMIMPGKLYRLFLSEFLAVRNGELASRVWKVMVRNGNQPTIREYTSMLQGCRRGRDFEGVERIWHRMMSMGLEPDGWAWTERIAALVQGGRHREGIAALESMLNKWKDAAAIHLPSDADLADVGDLPGAVKPPIAAVNALLTGFVKKKDLDFSERLIDWIAAYGVKPDYVTFTILVQIYLKMRDRSGAMNQLLKMSAANIEPGPEVVSIIISHTFRDNMGDGLLTAEESKDKITAVLKTFSQLGWGENRVILGILVDSLLKQHNNHDAAMAVVRHMTERGMEPNEWVYTSFITYYFSRSPPDVQSVNMIMDRMNHSYLVNSFLYDRAIEGFARCGEISKMMTILRRVSSHGRRNSWQALNQALLALETHEQFDLIEELVTDLETRNVMSWTKLETFNDVYKDGMLRKKHEDQFHQRVWELRQEGRIATREGRGNGDHQDLKGD